MNSSFASENWDLSFEYRDTINFRDVNENKYVFIQMRVWFYRPLFSAFLPVQQKGLFVFLPVWPEKILSLNFLSASSSLSSFLSLGISSIFKWSLMKSWFSNAPSTTSIIPKSFSFLQIRLPCSKEKDRVLQISFNDGCFEFLWVNILIAATTRCALEYKSGCCITVQSGKIGHFFCFKSKIKNNIVFPLLDIKLLGE